MGRKLPTWLTAEERKKVLSLELSARDRAILSVFLYAGLRSNELRMLDVEDIDFKAKTIFVRFAKRSKQRMIPLHRELTPVLKEYLAGRTSGPLFYSNRGQRISYDRLHSLIGEIGLLAGLRKHLRPHILRHSFAMALRDAGVKLEVIQELLGHDDIKTTMIYLHCSVEESRAAVDLI